MKLVLEFRPLLTPQNPDFYSGCVIGIPILVFYYYGSDDLFISDHFVREHMGRSKSTRRRTIPSAPAAVVDDGIVASSGADTEMEDASSASDVVVAPSCGDTTIGGADDTVLDGGTISSDSLGAPVVGEIDLDPNDDSLLDGSGDEGSDGNVNEDSTVAKPGTTANASGVSDSAVGSDFNDADVTPPVEVAVPDPAVPDVVPAAVTTSDNVSTVIGPAFYESVSLISDTGKNASLANGSAGGILVDASVVSLFETLCPVIYLSCLGSRAISEFSPAVGFGWSRCYNDCSF